MATDASGTYFVLFARNGQAKFRFRFGLELKIGFRP